MDKQIEQINVERELQGIKIPPQPQIMVDLYMEMVDPYLEIDRIASIICKDVGISGGVLKIVNSPFFGMRNQITSISQALNLLGIRAGAVGGTCGPVPPDGLINSDHDTNDHH